MYASQVSPAVKPEEARSPGQHRVHTAAYKGAIRRVKHCPGCDQDLVAEDKAPDCGFWVTQRYKGNPIFHALCKTCLKRKRRERLDSDPEYAEKERARGRRARKRWLEKPENQEKARKACLDYYYQTKAADPEGQKEKARMQYALRLEREGKKVTRRHPTVVDNTAPRLPIEPFFDWLLTYRRAWREMFDGTSDAALARHLGVEVKRIGATLAGQYSKITVDVVDRAILNAAIPVRVAGKEILTISDLYGDEYW